MRYLAGYLLAVLGGKPEPSAEDIRVILGSVGVEVDEESLGLVMEKMKGKDVEELQTEGMNKLATVFTLSGTTAGTTGQVVQPEVTSDPSVPDKKEQEADSDSDDDDELGILNLF